MHASRGGLSTDVNPMKGSLRVSASPDVQLNMLLTARPVPAGSNLPHVVLHVLGHRPVKLPHQAPALSRGAWSDRRGNFSRLGSKCVRLRLLSFRECHWEISVDFLTPSITISEACVCRRYLEGAMQLTDAKNLSRLQVATSEFLLSGDLNVFGTFTFGTARGVGYEKASRIFGTFAHALKSHLFGRNSRKRIQLVPVIEGYRRDQAIAHDLGIRQGTHIHCLMNLPHAPPSYRDVVRDLWINSDSACGDPKVYCPKSDKWFLDISNTNLQKKFVDYVLKTCVMDTDAVLWKYVPVRRPI